MIRFANAQPPLRDTADREPLPDVLRALPVSLAISGGMWLTGLAVFIVEWYRM